MGRYASDPGGGDFEDPEPGTYAARCYRVIDLGTQHSEKYDRDVNRVMVTWELVGTEMEDGRPFSMARFYTNSLHEKAGLRNDLEAWRGREFTEQELSRFDLAQILDKPCLLNVIHKSKDGKARAQVAAVMALPKGQAIGQCANKIVSFFLDEPDWGVFKTLSERLQKQITASPEYKRSMAGTPAPGPDGNEAPPPPDDDCPF